MSLKQVPSFFLEFDRVDDFPEVIEITFFERIFMLESYPLLVDTGSRQIETGLRLSIFVDSGREIKIDPVSPPIIETLPEFQLLEKNIQLIKDLYEESKFPRGSEELGFNHVKIVLVERRKCLNWNKYEEGKMINRWMVFRPDYLPSVDELVPYKLLEWR